MKMKSKLKNGLILLLLAAALTAFAGCGGGEQSTGTEETAAQTEAAAADDQAWKGAFLEVLQQDEEGIRSYAESGNAASGNVALSDLNGDGVPELLYFLRDQEHPFPYLKIYAADSGSARQISYEKAQASDQYSDLPSDAMYDYEIQGGTRYQVFLNGAGSLQMYSFIYGAENSSGTMNSYQMGADGIMSATGRFGMIDETMSSSLEPSSDDSISYWQDGRQIGEDEFESLCAGATDGVSELIFRTDSDGGQAGAAVWDATAGMSPVSGTIDEIRSELSQ